MINFESLLVSAAHKWYAYCIDILFPILFADGTNVFMSGSNVDDLIGVRS